MLKQKKTFRYELGSIFSSFVKTELSSNMTSMLYVLKLLQKTSREFYSWFLVLEQMPPDWIW